MTGANCTTVKEYNANLFVNAVLNVAIRDRTNEQN